MVNKASSSLSSGQPSLLLLSPSSDIFVNSMDPVPYEQKYEGLLADKKYGEVEEELLKVVKANSYTKVKKLLDLIDRKKISLATTKKCKQADTILKIALLSRKTKGDILKTHLKFLSGAFREV